MAMNKIFEIISKASSIAIAGHVRPDGDCVGSCMSMYNYINTVYPGKGIDVYLESVPDVFSFIENVDRIKSDYETTKKYDLFISLDCGDVERLGKASRFYEEAEMTINIDHHISNTNFARINYVKPQASSTCETLFSLLDETYINQKIAESLYTGIIHDTGVFKHSNTSQETMIVAGKLIEKGVSFSKIIDESFFQKTYIQNQLLGRSLLESILMLDGQCIISTIYKDTMQFYGAISSDIDGIIDQLRVTKGVKVAILLHEIGSQTFKVSMRSNSNVDVSKVAMYFGGGGHVKAAGCTMEGTAHDVINNVVKLIDNQLREQI